MQVNFGHPNGVEIWSKARTNDKLNQQETYLNPESPEFYHLHAILAHLEHGYFPYY